MSNKDYKCPLCGSILVRDRYIKIIGRWSDFEEERKKNEKLIEKYKSDSEAMEKKHKQDVLKATKFGENAGILKGIQKEKSERERMTKMIENQAKAISAGHKKIDELQKQLKEGKTPQIAGFDYEKDVHKILSENFPQDKIQPTGKKGDVIQFVIFDKVEIGSILYECKKTEKYESSFIKEIKRHQETAKADRLVIVTHASKEGKSKFFIEDNVIVIDPFGLLDIATLLRAVLIDIHQMKLTKDKAREKGLEIIRYMQSNAFATDMINTIEKSRFAYGLLMEEVKNHQKTWKKRIEIYSSIHENIQNVRKSIGQIVTGSNVEFDRYDFKQIESPKNL